MKNSFSDMHLINPLLAHARTCGIPEKITNILQRCAGMRVFQTDRAITEVIIYHCCNRLPRATPRNITQENLRCIAPAAALRRASMKWRGKKRGQNGLSRDPAAFHLLGGKRLIMCSKVRNSVILGDPSLLLKLKWVILARC